MKYRPRLFHDTVLFEFAQRDTGSGLADGFAKPH
jgi:hypothetical protein